MNKLRNIMVMIVMAMTAITISACSSDETIDNGDVLTGNVEVSAIGLDVVSATGGTGSIAMNSLDGATITCSEDWVQVGTPTTLKTGMIYPVVVSANSGNSNRTATITVTVSGQTYTYTVTQVSSDGLLVTSDKTVNVSADGGVITVTLLSNGDFAGSDDYNGKITETIGDSWITSNNSDTRASMTTYTRKYTVAANTVESSRTTTISYTLNNTTEQVTVIQEAKSAAQMSHTAMQLAAMMYPGWNLGNTLEGGNSTNNWTNNGGTAAETSWQSTTTTQDIIDYVKSQGFKSIRIPCSWVMGHITDADNCTIDETWMKRVQAVVDYAISDGLYVIINDHWDGGWLEQSFSDVSSATVTANSEKLTKIWTQIANRFKDYDEHLLFAGLNEPSQQNSDLMKSSSTVEALYAYENAFIAAVRATGGNNEQRTLIVQGPATDIDLTNSYYDISKISDTATDRLMVEVHFYAPWQFAGLEEDASWGNVWYYWGSSNTGGDSNRTASSSYNETFVNKQFGKLKTQFADKGYPVLIGEYGANWRFSSDALHNASIQSYYKAVNQYAISNGCVPMAWDTNYIGYPSMTIINRAALSIYCQYMLDGINEGLAAGSWPY